MRVFVVIPAYNEEKKIGDVVRDVLKNPKVFRCVVVDDGSVDKTTAVAQKAGAVVLKKKYNGGSGAATGFGLRYAQKHKPDVVILMDADGQHDPRYIKQLISVIRKGADYVIASRYIKDTENITTRLRKVGAQCISWWIWLWYGKRVYDVTSGYRAMNKRAIRSLCVEYPTNFSEPEIILDFLEKGYSIKEISSQMKTRAFGDSSISSLKAVGLMIYIMFIAVKKRLPSFVFG